MADTYTALLAAALTLMSCGRSDAGSSAPPLQGPQDSDVSRLKGTTWTKIDGDCGHGLVFEEGATMFHFFYACRASPNQRNAMASFGTYRRNRETIVGLRTGITCPALDFEREIEFIRSDDKMTVRTRSKQIVLTLKISNTQRSDDEVTYGCFDDEDSFTPHGWMP